MDSDRLWHQWQSTDTRAYLAALEGLSGAALDTDRRLELACALLAWNCWCYGSRADAEYVHRLVSEHPQWLAEASPDTVSRWRSLTRLWSLLFEGRRPAPEADVRHWDAALPTLLAAFCFNDLAAADRGLSDLLGATEALPPPAGCALQSHCMAARAWLAGELPQALDHARRSVELLGDRDSLNLRAGFGALYAALLAQAGRWPEALRQAARARRCLIPNTSHFYRCAVYLVLARLPLLREQYPRCLGYLRRALALGARERVFIPYLIPDEALAQLCALALQANIEPAYTRALIRHRALSGPGHSVLQLVWPWPCRLRLLGRFDLEVQGVSLGRLPQRRTRALLSELVIAGPQGIPQEQLTSRLWPDSAVDKALNCLHVAIHRVRESLQVPEAISVEGGLVALVADHLWVDAWALTELSAKRGQLSASALRQSVALYQGQAQLLVTDELQAAIYQEALNVAFRDLVLTLAQAHAGQDDEAAVACYRQAQRFLPLDERLWEGRLEAEARLDNPRMLALSFRQLEQAYRQDLDMLPPNRLLSVYQTLLAD